MHHLPHADYHSSTSCCKIRRHRYIVFPNFLNLKQTLRLVSNIRHTVFIIKHTCFKFVVKTSFLPTQSNISRRNQTRKQKIKKSDFEVWRSMICTRVSPPSKRCIFSVQVESFQAAVTSFYRTLFYIQRSDINEMAHIFSS